MYSHRIAGQATTRGNTEEQHEDWEFQAEKTRVELLCTLQAEKSALNFEKRCYSLKGYLALAFERVLEHMQVLLFYTV